MAAAATRSFYEEDEIVQRATRAWCRDGANDQPSNASLVRVINGMHYAVLHNTRGVLGVYRIHRVGAGARLEALPQDAWPREVAVD